MNSNKKAFTLIELVAVIVIISIIVLISVPIIINIKNKTKQNVLKRSIDAYGHAVELAMSTYELDTGSYPKLIDGLNVEYSGYRVECANQKIRKNGELFLSNCYVNDMLVEDKKTDDGYYHYGKSDYDYVVLYAKELENYIKNNQITNDNIQLLDSHVNKYSDLVKCNKKYMDDANELLLSECKVNNGDELYKYGRDINDYEYVDMYGKSLEKALKNYYDLNNTYNVDYHLLSIDYSGKDISCDVTINYDGTVYLTNCNIAGISVSDSNNEDGYYHYRYIKNAVNDLSNKANKDGAFPYSSGNVHEMYVFKHGPTVQTEALNDYRYIGSDPYNYVMFNNQLWRIVGVFTVEDASGNKEKRVKLVQNDSNSYAKYGSKSSSSYYYADWGNSRLGDTLNNSFYNYNISDNYKAMISDSKYYLSGDVDENKFGADDYYVMERSAYTHTNRSWTGKIGLLYLSDYLYSYGYGVGNNCYYNAHPRGACASAQERNDSWIYNSSNKNVQFSMSQNYLYSKSVYCISSSGAVSDSCPTENSYAYRAVFYLKNDVKIISGTGKFDDPYQLSM